MPSTSQHVHHTYSGAIGSIDVSGEVYQMCLLSSLILIFTIMVFSKKIVAFLSNRSGYYEAENFELRQSRATRYQRQLIEDNVEYMRLESDRSFLNMTIDNQKR